MLIALVLSAALAPTAPLAASEAAQMTATISVIQVHGNVLTPSDDILRLSGVTVGSPFESGTVDAVAARLEADGRFQRVDVLRRFASISDPTQIALVIIVDEGPVKIERTGDPAAPTRVVRSGGLRLLFLPVLAFEEGHGLTFGVRVARPDPIGPRSRLSFPLTWGGDRRAGVQLDKYLERGPFRRLGVGGSLSRRTHPFYDLRDARRRVWVRGDTRVAGPLRADVSGVWEFVTFGGQPDRLARFGAGLTVDTRVDPVLARNAVYARAAWDHLATPGTGGIRSIELEARGYVGLLGQSVLVVRAHREDASRSLPAYLKPMLGGTEILRGFRAGSAVGDTLTAGSLEVRVPLTSPLSFGKLGISVFVDAATVYDEGGRLRDQRFERGVGAGVWFSAAFLRFDLAVARGIGRGTRVNVGTNLAF